ncbi:aftiphilin [Cebidichthys violaceus]|uniref:aftiphilin n=1 Tax=Cebidichthys violaceus TaxID=271503 RepID=UPI0035CC84FE
MEPDVVPFHSSSPPPLDDDGDEEAGSEEDEFGDFGGFSVVVSCSHPVYADSTDSASDLTQPRPTTKPAAPRQPNCGFNRPVEQSQPTSAVDQRRVERQDCNAGSHVRLTNGYFEGDPSSGTHTASAAGARYPSEETGFADFTVFAEQAAHPWCCGFTPAGGKGRWDVRVERSTSSSSGGQISHPGQEVVLDSEPRSQCAHEAEGNVCTTVEHCEKRDAALIVQPSQDRRQSQEAAAALDFPPEEPHSGGEEEFNKPGDGQKERRSSLNSLQTAEMQKDGESDVKIVSTLPQTFRVYESASEDLASFSDDLSFECPSADVEPNVSSLVSHEDQTDWDQTDDEDYSDFSVNDGVANLLRSQAEKGFHYCDQSATQETRPTSSRSRPGTRNTDVLDVEDHECLQTADAAVQSLGNLPPSDSFADFCSAPTQEEGEVSWAEFKDQRALEEEKTWTRSREPVSSLQTDGDAEEEQDRDGKHGVSRRNSCQTSLSCRVQQLLLASFPEVEVPAVEGEEEVLSLNALLHGRLLPKSEEEEEEEEEIPELCPRSQWIRPHQDLHDAVGLRFQWGGSHTNRTLLRCLGVETRNIVFIGMKKQPVAVPAYASSLGMLEPTKDSVPAVCPPEPSTRSTKEALPSSQLDWSSRGLSSSQDDCSALNLDYFGPEEESRSSSSSSSSDSPPPGVDRELYELTVSKLETGAISSHADDTLNRLMSTAEKTSTSVRRPQQDEEGRSLEADAAISALPNLSFMQAKVLMFPSILRPEEGGSPKLHCEA